MYARATFIGRATKDCQICQLPSGTIKGDFSIAVNQKKDETSFFDIQCFDKKADLCGKFVTKGKLLYLECSIRPRTYEDKNGSKRHVTDYVLSDIKFLSSDKQNVVEQQERARPTLVEFESDDIIPFY